MIGSSNPAMVAYAAKRAQEEAKGASVAKKKVRVQFAEATGQKSKNGFQMNLVTGQIDAAMCDYYAANGIWPEAKVVAALTGIPEKRVAEHVKWWREKGNKRGNFYIG